MTTSKLLYPAQQIALALAQLDQLAAAGKGAEAERGCRGILAQYPDAYSVLNALALLLKARGETTDAEALMRRAIAIAPREAALQNNLGNILLQAANAAGAETAYRAAIALNPHYAEAFHNLGCVLQAAEQDEQALAAFRRAAAAKPDHTPALVQIAVQLNKKGTPGEALGVLRSAIASNPQHFGAHYYAGHTLTALGRFDEAIGELEVAIRLQPKSYEAAFALGNALLNAGHGEQALEAYRMATELAPAFVPAHYAFSQLAHTLGRGELDFTSYASARRKLGDQPDLLLSEADQHIRLGNGESAEQLLRRAREMAPERADIATALGRALSLQKRFGDAIEVLAVVAQSEPARAPHQRELGIALLQDSQFGQARRVLEDALGMAPGDQLSLAYLTLAYRALGDSQFDRLVDMEKFIGVYDLPPPDGFTDKAAFDNLLAEELLALHARSVEPFDQTLRGGTQTTGHLFERDGRAIRGLRDRIEEAVADYVKRLPDDASHPLTKARSDAFQFSGAWSTRLRSSGFHTNHVHHEGWISSAYYVSLPSAVQDDGARQGWLKFGESRLLLGETDRPARFIKPEVGKLVLFPSYFWHGTQPFTAQDPRIAVAFDVVPKSRNES